MPVYKIIETEEVTAEKLELIVNEWVSQGWDFDGFQFVTPESNRRPTLAFVIFTMVPELEEEYEEDDEENTHDTMTN